MKVGNIMNLNQSRVQKELCWKRYCKASEEYKKSIRTNTQNMETYSEYIKAEEAFISAYNKVEKLEKKEKQREEK